MIVALFDEVQFEVGETLALLENPLRTFLFVRR